jgi:hypothetical protein
MILADSIPLLLSPDQLTVGSQLDEMVGPPVPEALALVGRLVVDGLPRVMSDVDRPVTAAACNDGSENRGGEGEEDESGSHLSGVCTAPNVPQQAL